MKSLYGRLCTECFCFLGWISHPQFIIALALGLRHCPFIKSQHLGKNRTQFLIGLSTTAGRDSGGVRRTTQEEGGRQQTEQWRRRRGGRGDGGGTGQDGGNHHIGVAFCAGEGVKSRSLAAPFCSVAEHFFDRGGAETSTLSAP